MITQSTAQFVVLDTNDNGAKTTELDVSICDKITVFINNKTGDTSTCVVELQVAGALENGNSNWYMTLPDSALTGEDCKTFDISGICWVRMIVTTPEGGTSTSNVLINRFMNA